MPKSPQLEDGLTPIANELVEAFCTINLSAYEHRILWFIIRKTYGFHKKTDRISYSQFEDGTGIDRRHVCRILSGLKKRHIIICSGAGYALEYGIQKDYDLWINHKNIDTSSGAEIDTAIGADLTPKEATIDTTNLTPIQDKLTPIQGDLTPKEATNLTPKEAHTKERKILTKDTTKDSNAQEKKSFEEYKEEMRKRYPELDFDNEFQKFHEYWYEGRKICTNPKLALHNWLDRAREYKKQKGVNGNGSNKQNTGRPCQITPRDKYTDPDSL
jgi:phage replication O-like protein O